MRSKRFTASVMILIFIISMLGACSSAANESSSTAQPSGSAEVQTTDGSEVSDEDSALDPVEDTDNSETDPEAQYDMFTDGKWTGTGLEFVTAMKVGWNLGNTFDAYTDKDLKNELSYETSWQSTATTKELFEFLAESGFKTVRIPISWHNHVSGDDFTISDVWMDRINEVVDYAIDSGLYVIINTHHDVDPLYYYPSSEYLDSSLHYVECIWTQIAERFKDYDDHLVFESLNEPRLKDTSMEWRVSNTGVGKDSIECINQLNQKFVDVVRASGGNNSDRFLLVPGYDAAADGVLSDNFVVPSDTVSDRIIVSVHAYTPYNFALALTSSSGSTDQFTDSSKTEIDKFMKKLYDKFVVNDIPVLIGEFGAIDKDNLEARVEWASYYVSTARSYGMTCCWWDNNAFTGDGERLGLVRRLVNKFLYQDLADAMLDNCR